MPPRSDSDHRSDALWPRVRVAVAAERGLRAWLRARPTPVRFLLATGAVLVLVLVVLGIARRTDLAAVPVAALAVTAVLLVAAFTGLLLLLLRPLQRRAPRAWVPPLLAVAALLLPTLLVAGAPVHDAMHEHPASLAGQGDDLWTRAGACFVTGVLLGCVLLLVVRTLDRRDRVSGTQWLLLAALGGVVGNLFLFLHCPLVAPAHLLLGHATVPLGFLVVALLAPRLGRR